ncbi:hypothetical protein [Aureliella helgolandensis]|uniref:Uncharacterized protein n=1 Tax=Aureliella helgolandensis TaxID=2527968 RepID=A0A518GEH7_9BACT|nr:hypothetical protein [Aureliella helgolandensis]QDV26957.1 hypothetical protein Q31a_53370 [Aureliella helgolandensis]
MGRGAANRVVIEVNFDWRRPNQRLLYLPKHVMMRTTIAITLFPLLLMGCDMTPDISGVDLGGPSGAIAVSESFDGQPAIEYAVYRAGSRFMIWGVGNSSGGRDSGGPSGLTGDGHVGNVPFSFQIPVNGHGVVTIDGQSYKVDEGVIFLVSSGDDGTRVQQLKRDLTNVELDWDGLKELMGDGAEFRQFFDNAEARAMDSM